MWVQRSWRNPHTCLWTGSSSQDDRYRITHVPAQANKQSSTKAGRLYSLCANSIASLNGQILPFLKTICLPQVRVHDSQMDQTHRKSTGSMYGFIPVCMSRTSLYFADKFKSTCIFIFPGIIIQLNLLLHLLFLNGKKSMPLGFLSLRIIFKRKK